VNTISVALAFVLDLRSPACFLRHSAPLLSRCSFGEGSDLPAQLQASGAASLGLAENMFNQARERCVFCLHDLVSGKPRVGRAGLVDEIS
jgi:hypothetical protein